MIFFDRPYWLIEGNLVYQYETTRKTYFYNTISQINEFKLFM